MDIAKQAMPLKGQQTHVLDLYALVIIAHIDAVGGPRGVHAAGGGVVAPEGPVRDARAAGRDRGAGVQGGAARFCHAHDRFAAPGPQQ